jgi:hypothetical protein
VATQLEAHYQVVLRALVEGRVVPLLGAGVNRCGRPDGTPWGRGRYLPDGAELAGYLANFSAYPDPNPADLVRVSQYFSVMLGAGPLYDELHQVFDADYPPTPVHEFLAELPGEFRDRGLNTPPPLIITTNYDDVLERAFRAAGEPFDLVAYVAVGEPGRFVHHPPDEEPILIRVPNETISRATRASHGRRSRRCWNLRGARPRSDGPKGAAAFGEWSRGGGRFATVTEKGTVRVLSRDGRRLARVPGRGKVANLAFAPDGSTVRTVRDNGTVNDLASRGCAQRRALTLTAAAFSDDGRFAILGDEARVSVLNLRTCRQTDLLTPPGVPTRAVALSADGGTAVAAGADGAARVWDVGTRALLPR